MFVLSIVAVCRMNERAIYQCMAALKNRAEKGTKSENLWRQKLRVHLFRESIIKASAYEKLHHRRENILRKVTEKRRIEMHTLTSVL